MIRIDEDLAPKLPSWRITLGIIGAFLAAAFLAYGSSLWNDFVRFDDGLLIYENPAVRQFSFASLKVIFTTYDPELYIPLTLFVYQMLYLVFGINAVGYHVLSLLLHTGSALLLTWLTFTILSAQFKDRAEENVLGGVSITVGALFLLHPLNTEAVAWAAALKDQLSTFLYLVTFLLYLQFRATAESKPYYLSLLFFFLGLMAKVMVLTLPAVFLLLEDLRGRSLLGYKELWKRLVPYGALSGFFLIVALFGKSDIVARTSLWQTFLMACKSTIYYFERLVWPSSFSVIYPQAGKISLATHEFQLYLGLMILIAIAVFISRRWTKFLTFGFGAFLITVLPTYTNFSKGGDIFFASDRYAYLPSLALFVMFGALITWILSRTTFRSASARYGSLALGVLVACGLGWKAHAQSLTWENTETLFKHVIDVFPEEAATAHNNLGNVYRRQNKLPEAIEEFKKGLALRENARIRSNLAATYTNLGEYDLALDSYQKAKAFDPVNELPDFGLGILYAKIGKTQQALDAYAESLKKNPHYVAALLNRGSLYSDLGRYEEAEKDFRAAIEIEPLFSQAYFNLGVILQKQDKWDEAAAAYQGAVDAEPRYVDARMSLGIALAKLAKLPEAKSQFLEVLKLQPGNSSATNAIQRIDAAMGQ